MTSNQKLAQSVYELYKESKAPCPACVVLAADSQYTKFDVSTTPKIKKLYEETT